MRRFYFFILLLVAVTATNAQSWPPSTQETKPATRWWWLGSAVNKRDIRWNLEEYAKVGIGSVEITPIYGVQGNEKNDIQYLSPTWMKALEYVEKEGKRLNILIDMNTGTGWPFGGPYVPVTEAACKLVLVNDTVHLSKSKLITIDISVKDEMQKDITMLQRVMAYSLNDKKVIDITTYASNQQVIWKAPKGDWRIMAIYAGRTLHQVKRAAPGGEGLELDHFDRQAVAHYLEHFTQAFERNKTPYPHTFFNDSYEVYDDNWTPTLLDEFLKRRGYKLEEHMPELLGEVEDEQNQVLSDFRETLGDMLLENFTEQWTAWAHSHHVKTRNQAHGSPANLIDVYAAVDIPEIEGFGLSNLGIKGLRSDSGFTRKNYSDVSMIKYASSAAHITGKPLTSSETFTWLTEHFRTSLSQCKPDLDLMFTCGVNHIFFHGSCYTPKDAPWPGWKFYASIDMSPTNTIWRDAPYMMQYIERCQRFLQMGKPDNDFLVYLPIRDMWAKRHEEGEHGLPMQFEINNMYRHAPEFIKSILDIDEAGYDCDYISDKYLLTTSYKDGMLVTAAGTKYHALILPGSERMPDQVKAHIEALKKQGARIIHGTDKESLNKVAEAEAMRVVNKLRAIRRSNDKGYHYFIANLTSDDVKAMIPLTVPFASAMLFNPLNGERYMAKTDGRSVYIHLRSGESVILQTFNLPIQVNVPESVDKKWIKAQDLTNQAWTLSFIESAPKVNKVFNLSKLQTWETLPDDSVKVTMGTGVYTSHIHLNPQEAKAKSWLITLGDVRESARVYINGECIGCAWAAPFMLSFDGILHEGDNTIQIEVTNLPANRIAWYDRRGIEWRKFKDINIVDLNYEHTTYDHWDLVPSGLHSKVVLYKAN